MAGHEQEKQKQQIDTRQDSARNDAMDRLSVAFENSARRWELVVYPSLFAFIILAAYGFYLVYSLAKDVHYLAISVDSNMTVLSGNMQTVSRNMGDLSANVRTMAVSVESINNRVATLEPMLTNVDSMDQTMKSITQATKAMTVATHNMRNDMVMMNRNIRDVSRPMSFMGAFMPW
jgi:uncharacterized protein YoxC